MFPPVPASSAIVADLLPVLGSPTSKPLQLSIPPCTLDQSTIVAERTQLCNLWTAVPTREVKEVAVILKAIHAQEGAMRLATAVEIVENGIGAMLICYAIEPKAWLCQ